MLLTLLRSTSFRLLLCSTLVAGAVLALAAGVRAEANKQLFETVTDDGVLLKGDWYPSAKDPKNSPVIMLLHAIGPKKDAASRKDWEKYPEKLQAMGFNVLAFDFRGYGESTRLDDKQKYWTMTPGRIIPKPLGMNVPATISCKDWKSHQELLWLGNDLIAAKKWLNIKNNAMDCNSSNVCIIAAEQAAVLAQLWLANEHADPNRDKANDWTKPLLFGQTRNPSKWEGEDVSAVIWISMGNQLGTRGCEQLLRDRMTALVFRRAVNTLAIYGGDDKPVDEFWIRAIKWIKPEKEQKELEKNGRWEIPKTKLAGTTLATNEALGVEKVIFEYLEKHLPRGRQWQKQREDEKPILFNLQLATGPYPTR
jgi:hypothetical protein